MDSPDLDNLSPQERRALARILAESGTEAETILSPHQQILEWMRVHSFSRGYKKIRTAWLHEHFQAWATSQGHDGMSLHEFSRLMVVGNPTDLPGWARGVYKVVHPFIQANHPQLLPKKPELKRVLREESNKGSPKSARAFGTPHKGKARPIKDHLGRVYPSLSDCCRFLNLNVGNVYMVLNRRWAHTRGFVLTYLTEEEIAQIPVGTPSGSRVLPPLQKSLPSSQ